MLDSLKFNTSFSCKYGVIEDVTPLIRRIVAPNPSPFTFKGTGTYIIGIKNVAIIDPGPDIVDHVDAILASLESEQITHQFITHTHIDHSPAAKKIKERTGAVTYGFGPHGSGLYETGAKVEEGGDHEFVPDVVITQGDVIKGRGWTIECLHTPGHTSNHICYALREESSLFSGDHVMGWSTTVISPPDGHMGSYMSSLKYLSERQDDKIYYPTHGAPIVDPNPFVRALITHRKMREGQIISLLRTGSNTISEMVPVMYKGLDSRLIPAARLSVFAHVIDLAEQNRVICEGELTIDKVFDLI